MTPDAELKRQRQVVKIFEQLDLLSFKWREDHFSASDSDQANSDQEITENAKMLPTRNRNIQKKLDRKSAAITTAARSSLLSIACGYDHFSTIANTDSLTSTRHTINTETFKAVFFNQKHLPQHKYLDALPKLLLAQYVLRNESNAALKTYPFTFRLPTALHGHNITALNKKIQRKLTSEMKRPVELWMTYENDGYRSNPIITHCHGELSIYPHEFKKVKQTFIKIFKSVRPIQRQEPEILTRDEKILKIAVLLALKHITTPIQATDGTKTKKPMTCKAIIDLHSSGRNSATANHGKFYAVFNWVGYATKQELERKRYRFLCQITKKALPGKQCFLYISQDLRQRSEQFYKNEIK